MNRDLYIFSEMLTFQKRLCDIAGERNSATEVVVNVSEELVGYIREFSEDVIREKIIV